MGNDCPEIDLNDIRLAADQLVKTPMVLGPDHRGGSYLIGIDKSVFDREQFRNLPWQTNSIFSALTHLVKDVKILQAKRDINSSRELHAVLNIIKRLKKLVRLILAIEFSSTPVFYKETHLLALPIQRGPPS